MQSEPVSPPPITTTCLPFAVIVPRPVVARASSSPAMRLFCCVRKSIAKWMPSSARPGTSRSRGHSAPPDSTTASASCSSDVDRQGRADLDAGAERDAFGRHLLDAPVDQVLLHLEVGNAVAQQAADTVALLEQGHRMPGARKLLRTGEAGRTGTDHRDALAGSVRRRMRMYPAFLPAAIDDGTLDRLDGHRIVVDVQRAGGLARRGTDASGELGKVVGGMQRADRRLATDGDRRGCSSPGSGC